MRFICLQQHVKMCIFGIRGIVASFLRSMLGCMCSRALLTILYELAKGILIMLYLADIKL